MKYPEFAEIVRGLTERAARDPSGYRMRVVGFAALGYAYLFAVIVGLLVLIPLAVWLVFTGNAAFAGVKLLAIAIVPLGAILKSLWVRIPPPSGGVQLQPDSAPELFEMIEKLRTELGAPAVHRVLVTPELNAAIVQSPRLGMLGWYRNYLIVGLPLLQALSPTELQSVLAHELGHLSGSHGRFGAWIYRKRQTWAQLARAFADDNLLVGRFLRWYVPNFNATTFVLARQQEYEADHAAAVTVGAEAARDALLRIELVTRYVQQEFWPEIEASARSLAEPPRNAFHQLRRAVQDGPPAADAAVWLSEALKRPTGYADTHPTLTDRLRGLGFDADLADGALRPPSSMGDATAAAAYLGEMEESITQRFDGEWATAVEQGWKGQHDRLVATASRLEELDATDGELSADEQWERVCLTNDLGRTDEAFRLAEALAGAQPQHAGAQLFMGRALLAKGDPTGIELVERAVELDDSAATYAQQLLFDFHWKRGEREVAEQHLVAYESRAEAEQALQRELARVDKKVQLEPHDLPDAVVEQLREALGDYRQVRRAYLARRVIQQRPDQRIYLVGIQMRFLSFEFQAQKLLTEITSGVRSALPVYYVMLTGQMAWLRKRMKKVEGSRVL